MEIHALGPVGIVSPASQLAPKPRALLAILVAARGRTVSVDTLVEELWPTRRPGNPANLVQQYVGRVRSALDDTDNELLSTVPGGYRLGGVAVDVDEFQRLTDLSATDDDPAAQLERLDRALGLWQGRAYADVPATPLVAAEAARLEELRFDALEQRTDAALALGQHQTLVSDLQGLVGDQPLRERYWAQLMTALWASGRQAEALAAYRRLYQVLDTELGIEPSRPVRDLHQQILTEETPLGVPRPAPTAVVPRQLRAVTGSFVGREDQLARLDKLLADTTNAVPIAAISGTAGVGKTTLALHWGHRVADRFPDGQLYLNLRGYDAAGRQTTIDESLDRLLDGLGVPAEGRPTDTDGRAAAFRSKIADRRILVILDNARNTAQVEPLLPGSPSSTVVITSRNQLTGLVVTTGAKLLLLDHLSPTEARELLALRLGHERVASEVEAVDRIVELCARLPLPLSLVAARAATTDLRLADLATELTSSRLDALSVGEETDDIRAVFSWSYQHLSPDAAEILRLLGLHPIATISIAAAASLIGRSSAATARLLRQLTEAMLLRESPAGRYVMHDLLREYAEEICAADPPSDSDSAVRRMVDHYLHTTWQAVDLIDAARPRRSVLEPAEPETVIMSFAERDEAWSWLHDQHGQLVAMLRLTASDPALFSRCHSLMDALDSYLELGGHWDDWRACGELAAAACERAGDRQAQVNCLGSAAGGAYLGGDLVAARQFLDQKSLIAAEMDDPNAMGSAAYQLGHLAYGAGDYESAVRDTFTSIDLYKRAGNVYRAMNAITNVAWFHALLGNHDKALDFCEQAYDWGREHDLPTSFAGALDTEGYVRMKQGDTARAIECFTEAIPLYEADSDPFRTAEVLEHLGEALMMQGDRAAARETWLRGLGLWPHDDELTRSIRARLDETTP